MKKAHFYKVKSRIGLTNKPVRQTELNIGVEDAPDLIVTADFLSNFSSNEVSEFEFSLPENIKPGEYLNTLEKELVEFKDLINKELKEGQTQVVVGGENSVTFSSLLALIERVGQADKIGYIQLDSHGEINSFYGSDSHNFHGMYMRPFFDKFDIPEIDNLVPQKMLPKQMFVFGDQILDGDEPQFYQLHNLHSVTFEEYKNNKSVINANLKQFLAEYEFIHVNFDIDIFHRSVAGATGIPEDGKWMLSEVMELLNIISEHKKLSFDISEINPKKEGAEQTIKIAQKVLEAALV